MIKKLSQDLVPGDKYKVLRMGEMHTVEILGNKEEDSNQFGLPWFKFWATNGQREGYVNFGPNAKVTLV